MAGMTSPGGAGPLEHHRPLASYLVEARAPEASALLDPSEHGFNDLLARAVAAALASRTSGIVAAGGACQSGWPRTSVRRRPAADETVLLCGRFVGTEVGLFLVR
jgi:hypothetical protein